MQSEFIAPPDGWPHEHIKPRSEAEAERLMAVAPDRVVFVFGSNLNGRHAGGAAKHAADFFGAIEGLQSGRCGLSHAIPTIGFDWRPMPLDDIRLQVDRFISESGRADQLTFYVTPIGTGIAGLPHEQMAPLFANSPRNCLLPPSWLALLGNPQTGEHA